MAMPHSDNDISLFVSLVDIPVRLGRLRQGIAPVNDSLYLSDLNQRFEKK